MLPNTYLVRRLALAAILLLTTATGCESPDSGSETAPDTPSEQPNGSTDGESSDESDNGGEPTCQPPDVAGVGTVDVVEGRTFDNPTYVTQAPGDDQTLYIVERPGRILVVRNGQVRQKPFLDITDRVGTRHQERGLLGLAFHPDYQQNGRFFIYYTPQAAHKNVVAEYARAEQGTRLANDEEVRRLIDVRDPEDNHNGGMIAFDDQGYLFVGMGDGGGAGDRHGEIGNGQNTETLLGSILRLDVDAPDRNFAAAGNPFVDGSGDRRIWAYGLRNPWRFSFDLATGDLYIGDVGQNKIEEIDYQPADTTGGENYGWRAYEGRAVFDEDLVERVDDHVEPIVTYRHTSETAPIEGGCSVTGGYVYRGDAHLGLQGAYVYGDFCSDDVAAFRYCDGEVVGHRRVPGLSDLENAAGLGSFGQGNDGELYLLYHATGHVKRLVDQD